MPNRDTIELRAAEAADIVAEAAAAAAMEVAKAAKSAVDSAMSAASSAQILGAVTAAQLANIEKRLDSHEIICTARYNALGSWIKSMFFILLTAVGVMVFYLITHH
jgi:hypothetical protein